jgi:hypothetical protein
MPSAELDRLVEVGLLEREAPLREEFNALIEQAAVRLEDAKNESLAPQSRFDLAYNGCHAIARAALRWHGYRPRKRYIVFQALGHTLGIAPETWRMLDKSHTTQPDQAEALDLADDVPTRRKFLARLQGEISKRGTIDVLRHGIRHGPHDLDLLYGTPSPGNPKAQERYAANRFSVTRQLRYSRDETQLALDLALFINGLPVATFELKDSLTKQTYNDAIQQYMRDRNPREKLFEFGRRDQRREDGP